MLCSLYRPRHHGIPFQSSQARARINFFFPALRPPACLPPSLLPTLPLLSPPRHTMHPLLPLLDGNDCAGVVDVRLPSLFAARHIRHSLPIPGLVGLHSRFSWLPPPGSGADPGRRLLLICRREEEGALRSALKRWNVVGVVHDDDEQFWSEAAVHGLVVGEGADEPALLFEPSPLVPLAVQAWEAAAAEGATTATVLDLGCGAARDIAWIARRPSSIAWLATGVDNLAATVQRALLLRDEMGLGVGGAGGRTSHIEDVVWAQASLQGTLQALECVPGTHAKGLAIGGHDTLPAFAAAHLPHRTYDVILLIRFLPRPLLAHLPALAHDGTIVAISHFTTLDGEPDYASPDAAKRFEAADVAHLLEIWGPSWRLFEQRIHRAEDGRPIRSVLLRRIDPSGR